MRAPLYHKIYSVLRKRIDSRELKPGDVLPTEAELGKAFEVSLAPVRQALALLQNEGLILRQPGKGTFVAPVSEEMELWLNFSPFRRYFRKYWNRTGSRIIEVGEKIPPASAGDFLSPDRTQKAIYVERVRTIEGRPVIANHYYINPVFDIRPYIESGDFFSPRSLILEKFSVEVTRIEDILTAEPASAHLAKILEVPAGHPLLLTTRSAFSGETPVLMDIFHTVTGIWDYRVTFEKSSTGKVTASAGR